MWIASTWVCVGWGGGGGGSCGWGVGGGGGAEHTERGFSVDGQLLSSPRHWPYTKALGLNPNFHSAVGILEQNS